MSFTVVYMVETSRYVIYSGRNKKKHTEEDFGHDIVQYLSFLPPWAHGPPPSSFKWQYHSVYGGKLEKNTKKQNEVQWWEGDKKKMFALCFYLRGGLLGGPRGYHVMKRCLLPQFSVLVQIGVKRKVYWDKIIGRNEVHLTYFSLSQKNILSGW